LLIIAVNISVVDIKPNNYFILFTGTLCIAFAAHFICFKANSMFFVSAVAAQHTHTHTHSATATPRRASQCLLRSLSGGEGNKRE